MKQINKKQIPQASSIAYILFDLFKKASNPNSYICTWLGAGIVEPIKKSTAKNIIAKALGYTSWSHLVMVANKTPDNPTDSVDYLVIFSSVDQCISFFEKEFRKCNFKNKNYVLKRIANELFFDYSKEKYPFISEFLNAYDFECDVIDDDNHYTIFFKGDKSVGIQPFYTNIGFKTKKELDCFLQDNIEIIRSEYVELDNIDRVMNALEAKFNKLK